MLTTADLHRFPLDNLGDLSRRGVPFTTLGIHPRLFLDTALIACGIAGTMTDAELRDYESGADQCRIR